MKSFVLKMKLQMFGYIILQIWLLGSCRGQVIMEELKVNYSMSPMDMLGMEAPTNLTIDQIIMKAMGGIGAATNLISSKGYVLCELDMNLTENQYWDLYRVPGGNARQKRKATRNTVLRWTANTIPYRFVSNHFSLKEQYMIRQAMTEWERYTCLKFRPATSTDQNLVRFQNGQGCNSQLGMSGGQQSLNLDQNGCRWRGLYLHEIGHAIGLVHEHQLPVRDSFITIQWQNVQRGLEFCFDKYSSEAVDMMNVPYEYSSVMHYGVTAFSKDGRSKTILVNDPKIEEKIGAVYMKELSYTDVEIVNKMYKCSDHCVTNIRCYNGYLDENCRCVCKDGSEACVQGQPGLDAKCGANSYGDDWQCAVWANSGQCETNPNFMNKACARACGPCVIAKTDGGCSNRYLHEKCSKWAEEGDCLSNKMWMEYNCCEACRSTGGSGSTVPNCANIHPKSDECDRWAKEGECGANPLWMIPNCRMSCGACGKPLPTTPLPPPSTTEYKGDCRDIYNSIECEGWAETGECELNPDWMIPNCRRSCKKCPSEECVNIFDDSQCDYKAQRGECLNNKDWMEANCRRSCKNCTAPSTSVPPTTKATIPVLSTVKPDTSECKNEYKDDKMCNLWTEAGNCPINPWMTKFCAKACKKCRSPGDTTDKTITNTPSLEIGCKDINTKCNILKKHGYCEINPAYAIPVCKKTCGACQDNTVCQDNNAVCPLWKKGLSCTKNANYMLRNCQKSCEIC
ncbi:hypothetical protein CHS0354_023310 [Potamilus streckersoni]|uniref:Metalloendopeptidase n=1 Tax=Potamilus streckersoni TaxID=2493646 RepID=A0AAE0W798_9BIVA|nr:hypothetical protein CHS0354_023310 [Potamilus streckersoni]